MLATSAIVIFHKDHPLDPLGANGGAETATIALARTLALLGREVYVAAEVRGPDARDGMVAEGMEEGAVESWDRIEEILQTL